MQYEQPLQHGLEDRRQPRRHPPAIDDRHAAPPLADPLARQPAQLLVEVLPQHAHPLLVLIVVGPGAGFVIFLGAHRRAPPTAAVFSGGAGGGLGGQLEPERGGAGLVNGNGGEAELLLHI